MHGERKTILVLVVDHVADGTQQLCNTSLQELLLVGQCSQHRSVGSDLAAMSHGQADGGCAGGLRCRSGALLTAMHGGQSGCPTGGKHTRALAPATGHSALGGRETRS